MADRSLTLCGRLADGLIVSNLCPPAYTARAVAIVRESAAVAKFATPVGLRPPFVTHPATLSHPD